MNNYELLPLLNYLILDICIFYKLEWKIFLIVNKNLF